MAVARCAGTASVEEDILVTEGESGYRSPMMVVQQPAGLADRRLQVVVIFLCVCVIMQMLGVPVTLFNLADVSDTRAASVLEGYSVPPTLPELALSPESVLVTELHPPVYARILASALFHPPVH